MGEPFVRSLEDDHNQPEMMDHELLLDLDDIDNGNYIESLDRSKNMIDDHCSCTCSTDSFLRDVRVDTAVKVLDKKLRNLPTCMKSQAYSDVLLYIRYLRRKHRKMVMRGAEKRIPGC